MFPIATFLAALFATLGRGVAAKLGDDPSRHKRPNVVILFADNLALNDVGAFRSPPRPADRSRTPRTDALAAEGVRLLHWNSPAVLCSASRSALLTGRYPVRTGVYPRVFEPDASHGLLSNETTIADLLREEGYATKIVGKWHLGSRPGYLPTDRGFDAWFGVPYHMSGGSLDGHVCGKEKDPDGTRWLPLFDGQDIVEQPVNLRNLAPRYVDEASSFIHENAADDRPFFLYMAFSHVHQLCAPRISECQWASAHFSRSAGGFAADFDDAVEEMDWILGGVLDALDDAGVADDTLVIFTSDNGPWAAEPSCSGSKGQFEARWLRDHVDDACTACPSEYEHAPVPGRPRRCAYPDTDFDVEGVHCGEDSGLGSAWEANVRMPAVVRWRNGGVPAGTATYEMVSTLDVLPTVMGILDKDVPADKIIDGVDVKAAFLGGTALSGGSGSTADPQRPIFFWRDGFKTGPLPQPFGRFDVAAMKMGWIKIWFYTKSSHYNADEEVYHDPPLLFDVLNDPAESKPLDPNEYADLIEKSLRLLSEHKASVDWTRPLTLSRDPKYVPCSNAEPGCRTFPLPSQPRVESIQAEE